MPVEVIMGLSKEAILSASDLPRKTIRVPEWGGNVTVRTMTGVQHDAWSQEWHEVRKNRGDLENTTGFEAFLAIHTVVDEAGNPLFSANDLDALNAKSAKALSRVARVALRLSGIGADEIEDMAKNSESGQTA